MMRVRVYRRMREHYFSATSVVPFFMYVVRGGMFLVNTEEIVLMC